MENEEFNDKENCGVHPLTLLPEILLLVTSNNAMLKTLLDSQAQQLHTKDPSKSIDVHREELRMNTAKHFNNLNDDLKIRMPDYFPDDV